MGTETLTRRDVLRTGARGLLAASALGVAGCGVSQASGSGGPLRIALSNSYIGNTWRIEMENLWKAALQMEPYASQVEGPIYNATNSLRDQSQQLSNIVSLGVDAIVVNAASPTALNGILGDAIDQGILVVSFDNTVTAPGALKVNTDQVEFGRVLAQHLVDLLDGKGNIIMVTGVPGTTVDADRNKGATEVFSKHDGIRIVNRYPGMWDSSVAQKNTANIIASLPRIDGIWAQGGTDGILKAFRSAGRPLPPTCGEAENGFRKFLAGMPGYPKVHGLSVGQPPFLSVVALEAARQILREGRPREDVTIPLPMVTDKTVKEGVTVFPDVVDSFFDAFTDPSAKPVVRFCLPAAQKGKPCARALKVNLPAPRGT